MSQQPHDESQAPAASRRPLLLLAGALVLVAAFLGGRVLAPLLRGTDATPPAQVETAKREAPPPAAPTVAPVPEAPATTDTPAASPRTPRKPARPAPEHPAPSAAPTTAQLKIDSDVPGAMVFLDRVYLGAAPVTASNVTPGTHQLNVSAEGYDGYSQTLDLAAGSTDVMVRFKEIRLNEAMDVVHTHGIGSCEGRLLADANGVRYETTNRDDAFSLKFSEVEVFEVDYLKKNLRVKRRGGKTWNFTTRAENADPLFVFHRTVDKVRQKLAGVAPSKGK